MLIFFTDLTAVSALPLLVVWMLDNEIPIGVQMFENH